MGKVYLVGGGPGDLGLFTLKGYELVERADCIIYDRLVNEQLLAHAKSSCEKIYVGKQNHHHTMTQDQINALLVEKAKQYACVVRLKGGDVYVFGRGGEEGMYMHQHHIDFEVVPGISSCLAGLAYAGIPITHRGIAGGFHVMSAHNAKDELSEIDFESLVKSKDTCVFLMGLSKLEEIVSRLLAAKMADTTPIALISNATLPTQRTVVGTLRTIVDQIHKQPLPSPALIVVGDVIELRKELNFYERKPLFNKKIVLPKVRADISPLAKQLTEQGANVQELQVVRLLEDETALAQVNLLEKDWIVLSSRFAVDCLMRQLQKQRLDIRKLHALKFAVVGEVTAQALAQYGLYADFCPTYYSQEVCCKEMLEQLPADTRILIPCVKGGEKKWEKLGEKLQVEIIALYEHVMEAVDPYEMDADLIVFTCSSAVRYTLSQIKLNKKTKVFSIGTRTTQTLNEMGVHDIIQSSQASYASLIDAIMEEEKQCIEEED